MGLFSSKSIVQTTSQTDNYNTDARMAADGGSIVARNSRVTITDGGAIRAARDTARDAFDLAEGVADLGADFVFDALGFVQSNTRDAFDHAGDSQRDALGFVQSNSRDAFDYAGDSAERAFDFANSNSRDAFDFTRQNTSDTLGLIEATQNAAFGYVQQGTDASNALVTRTIEQQREESAQLGSQILRLGIPAIAILGLIFIMKGNG